MRVQRHPHRAHRHAAEVGRDEVEPVLPLNHDPIAGADPLRAKPTADRPAERHELPVAEPAVEAQRRPVGVHCKEACKE